MAFASERAITWPTTETGLVFIGISSAVASTVHCATSDHLNVNYERSSHRTNVHFLERSTSVHSVPHRPLVPFLFRDGLRHFPTRADRRHGMLFGHDVVIGEDADFEHFYLSQSFSPGWRDAQVQISKEAPVPISLSYRELLRISPTDQMRLIPEALRTNLAIASTGPRSGASPLDAQSAPLEDWDVPLRPPFDQRDRTSVIQWWEETHGREEWWLAAQDQHPPPITVAGYRSFWSSSTSTRSSHTSTERSHNSSTNNTSKPTSDCNASTRTSRASTIRADPTPADIGSRIVADVRLDLPSSDPFTQPQGEGTPSTFRTYDTQQSSGTIDDVRFNIHRLTTGCRPGPLAVTDSVWMDRMRRMSLTTIIDESWYPPPYHGDEASPPPSSSATSLPVIESTPKRQNTGFTVKDKARQTLEPFRRQACSVGSEIGDRIDTIGKEISSYGVKVRNAMRCRASDSSTSGAAGPQVKAEA